MVFINAGKINTNGMVDLTFSHASDYVVVVSDKKMSQADVPADLKPSKDKTDGNKGNADNKKSVKTGDDMNAVPMMIMLLIAAGVIAACGLRLRKRNK